VVSFCLLKHLKKILGSLSYRSDGKTQEGNILGSVVGGIVRAVMIGIREGGILILGMYVLFNLDLLVYKSLDVKQKLILLIC